MSTKNEFLTKIDSVVVTFLIILIPVGLLQALELNLVGISLFFLYIYGLSTYWKKIVSTYKNKEKRKNFIFIVGIPIMLLIWILLIN